MRQARCERSAHTPVCQRSWPRALTLSTGGIQDSKGKEVQGIYPGLGELLHGLDLFVGDDVQEANDARLVPLVLLLDRAQDVPGIPVPVVVAAEEPLLSPGSLEGRQSKRESENSQGTLISPGKRTCPGHTNNSLSPPCFVTG